MQMKQQVFGGRSNCYTNSSSNKYKLPNILIGRHGGVCRLSVDYSVLLLWQNGLHYSSLAGSKMHGYGVDKDKRKH